MKTIASLAGQAAFRATFLLNLSDSHADILRGMGELLETLFKNLENDAEAADLGLQEAALVADLRHLHGFLGWIAKHTTSSTLTPEQFAIAQRATALAPRLFRLIEEIDAALPAEIELAAAAPERVSIRADFWVQIPTSLAQRAGLEPAGEAEWEVVAEGLLLRTIAPQSPL